MNRASFFASVRKDIFNGKLSQSQVMGLDALLEEYEKDPFDLRWMAYMLATAYHETAATMQPIAEYGKGKGRKYGVPGKYGQVPYGRGWVQLTWDFNYEKADEELNLNGALLKNFDLALDLHIATRILFRGMFEGWFTAKKLSDYFNDKLTDWVNARRIINGTDKAQHIAGIAQKFHAALKSGSEAMA